MPPQPTPQGDGALPTGGPVLDRRFQRAFAPGLRWLPGHLEAPWHGFRCLPWPLPDLRTYPPAFAFGDQDHLDAIAAGATTHSIGSTSSILRTATGSRCSRLSGWTTATAPRPGKSDHRAVLAHSD